MPSGLDALREERRRFAEELAVLRSAANTTRGSASISAALDDSSEWRPGEVALEPSAAPSSESNASGAASIQLRQVLQLSEAASEVLSACCPLR